MLELIRMRRMLELRIHMLVRMMVFRSRYHSSCFDIHSPLGRAFGPAGQSQSFGYKLSC
jgi:hypothetical protein